MRIQACFSREILFFGNAKFRSGFGPFFAIFLRAVHIDVSRMEKLIEYLYSVKKKLEKRPALVQVSSEQHALNSRGRALDHFIAELGRGSLPPPPHQTRGLILAWMKWELLA
jgi:hypothetical protein